MKKSPPNLKNITGLEFERLVVVARWGADKGKQAAWICLCDCGEYVVVSGALLRNGNTKSCGCLARELTRERNKKRAKHNMAHSRLWYLWTGIKQRCYNKNGTGYKYYGGRGIKVSAQWKNNFKAFAKWAFKNGWKQGLEIDRKDNNSDYEPDNCRFVTTRINSLNKSSSRIWIVDNKNFRSAQEAAKYFNVSDSTIQNWCLGRRQRGTSPKPNCSAPKLYQKE